MPAILNPNMSSIPKVGGNIRSKAIGSPFTYDYPNGLDLRPSETGLYMSLKNDIINRARTSRESLYDRFNGWADIDKTLTTYIYKDDKERDIKEADRRKPVRVVIPVTYAVLETLLTYWSAAFLEEPYFRYEGVGSEDVIGAKMLEMAVAQQCRRGKVGLDLHTMWRDSFAYGFGVSSIGWERKTGYRTVKKSNSVFSMLRNAFKETEPTFERERVEIYAGSTLRAVDPYSYLPDPDVPIERVQEGEFVGWIERTNYMDLMALERDNPDEYFNVRYLGLLQGHGKSIFANREDTGRYDKYGKYESSDTSVSNPIDVIHMYRKIIPKDLGVGDEEYPEIWLFSLAADQVIIRAQPLGLDHEMFPVAISAPDYDGHSMTPISRLETVYGLQQTIDWLFDSRIANVRKAINDALIVDPQLVNIHDIANPKPGKLIRMRRQAWGRGVKDAVMQLDIRDVTTNHIGDVSYIQDIVRNTTGATDILMGIRRKTSERVSATEASDVKSGGLSRLEKAAKIASMQAHQDIAYQMAWNTRQLMDRDIFVKIIGNLDREMMEDLYGRAERGRIAVTPQDLDIDFDVIMHDGSIPSNGSPEMWIQLFQIMATNPYLSQSLDIVRVFKHAARLMGAKNINEFVRRGGNVQPEVVPDQQALDMAESGKIEGFGA